MKFRMADIQRANVIQGYQNKKHLCLPMECVCMWSDLTPMLFVRKE